MNYLEVNKRYYFLFLGDKPRKPLLRPLPSFLMISDLQKKTRQWMRTKV